MLDCSEKQVVCIFMIGTSQVLTGRATGRLLHQVSDPFQLETIWAIIHTNSDRLGCERLLRHDYGDLEGGRREEDA